ncbi:MAG: ATP-binding protein [Elusimicrobiota bacterium]
MIVQFKVKNFLSFKGEEVFDLRSTMNKNFNKYGAKQIKKDSILNFAVIYGPNASGKTNLLKALGALKKIIFFNANDKDQKINYVVPFLLDENSKDKNSEFEITFYFNDTKYVYNLKINQNEFAYELLNVYLTNRPSTIFERKTEDGISKIEFGNSVKIGLTIKKEMEIKCLKNISVFMAYKQINYNIDHIENIIKWFYNNFNYFEFSSFENTGSIIRKLFVGEKINNDEKFKNKLLNFLKYADINISDMSAELKKIKLNEKGEQLESNKSDSWSIENFNYYDIKYFHRIKVGAEEKQYSLPEELQSRGTLNFLCLVSVLLSVSEGSVLAFDEIENSIHPMVLKYIIEKFIRERSGCQLIATTHYDGLLECDDVIRMDSIYFTSKKEDGSTELYSLSDFKELNRLSSLRKAYEYGKFGAIPDIKDL